MFSGDFYPVDRYPPFSVRLELAFLGEYRKLLSAIYKKNCGIMCQRYLVLTLASQIAGVQGRPVSVSNDRYPESSGPRVMLQLSEVMFGCKPAMAL